MMVLACLVIAFVLFLLAGVNVSSPRVNLVALAWAALVLAAIAAGYGR